MQKVITAESFTSISQREVVSQHIGHNQALTRFMNWCAGQEENRFIWLAIGFLGTIGMVLPLTVSALLAGGVNNFALLMLTCVVNVPVLALNLAAQSTKVTLPVLFFAWLVDAAVIIYSAIFYLTA
jgi:tetrahydromethanopterin S-methyltransferase subunit F